MGNQYILEVLQSKDCPCFINRLLEASEGDITSLNLREVDDNQNNFEETKIINDTIDNLTICKNYYSNIYTNIGATFHQYLQKIPALSIEKMEED